MHRYQARQSFSVTHTSSYAGYRLWSRPVDILQLKHKTTICHRSERLIDVHGLPRQKLHRPCTKPPLTYLHSSRQRNLLALVQYLNLVVKQLSVPAQFKAPLISVSRPSCVHLDTQSMLLWLAWLAMPCGSIQQSRLSERKASSRLSNRYRPLSLLPLAMPPASSSL
jgi:hypothetical protein